MRAWEFLQEDDDTLKLPNINVGDEVKVGRFKNRKATVKGFKKDDHNQPILKTTKGDQKLFKPRISKLEEIKRNWVGDKHPKDMPQDEFMKLHKTGSIPSNVYLDYEKYDGLDWINPKDYSNIIAKRDFKGKEIEFRKSGVKNKYVKQVDDEIVRDEQGNATYLTNKEMRERNLPTEDQTIAVFYNDHPIGLASNEFGSVGIWVIKDFQNKGIGTMLSRIFMKQNPHMKLGQMTAAGDNLARNVWKSFQKKDKVK